MPRCWTGRCSDFTINNEDPEQIEVQFFEAGQLERLEATHALLRSIFLVGGRRIDPNGVGQGGMDWRYADEAVRMNTRLPFQLP